ncbi:peptide deformylase [bacterium]|nr:peptide deformylase [bacterium]
MAVRKILKFGDPFLREKAKDVHKVSRKIQDLVTDLLDTMYASNGVGLAAPQIGENYRVFVVDVSTGDEPLNPIVFINPKLIKKSGATISREGCLSFPEAFTDVRRYSDIMIKAMDRKGRSFVMEVKDGPLLARAIQHEYDHLDGILFVDHAINRFDAEEQLNKNNLPPLEIERMIDEPELAAKIDELLEAVEVEENTDEEHN